MTTSDTPTPPTLMSRFSLQTMTVATNTTASAAVVILNTKDSQC